LAAEVLGGGLAGVVEGKGGGGLTQTLKLRFLYVTDSTLKPIVGIVVTTSPIWGKVSMVAWYMRVASLTYFESV
jgi:hypothetical protein